MEIQQAQQITVQDALKALADYRAAAGIRTVKYQPSSEDSLATGLEQTDGMSAHALPRIGRHINIMA